uniref:Primase/helicase n=1 Tax=uncultured marine virus TaxID=186617 RepID=A0A0F7L8C8_9VIRU|nr:primase/helicase [uncultured marine virus]
MDSPQPKRRRARKPDGSFKGDNPSTPDLNEAWEPTPIEAVLPKEKYAKKDMISTTSSNSAGKYGSSSKVTKPGLGKISTTYF